MKSESQTARLMKGKAFHLKIQSKWKKGAQGNIEKEKRCIKPNGKRGRIDIHAHDDEDKKLVACVEIKNTNWDKIDKKRISAYVNKQANQIWDYIESELKEGKEISPGIIFPKKPMSDMKSIIIETRFEEKGIPVVWINESIEERKDRNSKRRGY